MWKMSKMRHRRGFAMIFVVLIALAMVIPAMILASSAVSRRKIVSGEAVSDRAISIADAKIDSIMNTINTFPQVNVSGQSDENAVQKAIIACWEGMLNGYTNNPYDPQNSENVLTYFYNSSTDTWYVLWNGTENHVMNVPKGTKVGREISPTDSTSGTVLEMPVKNLNTGVYENKTIIQIDPDCRTNNVWFEVDTNSNYNKNPSDIWTITVTSYMLSKPSIIRTVQAKAEKVVKIKSSFEPTTKYEYNWYTKVNRHIYFSDYVFLDNFDVNFGKYSTTTGPIRANGTVNMGGWATYPVYSSKNITDKAVDDYNNHDGRFGPNKNTLKWARKHNYANEYQSKIDFLKVDQALTGTNPARDQANDTGLQDKAFDQYYVDRDATIVFSVVTDSNGNKVGKVTINGNTYDMPPNGIIYVEGDAKVKGNVIGRCIIGSSGNIYISGDITYNTPPRTSEDDPFPDNSDFEPDFLGLVAKDNVLIPYSTYQSDKHLKIDAAIVAGCCFGINPNDWPGHYLNADPNDPNAPTLVVKGAIAAGDGTLMPAYVYRTWLNQIEIKGYDLRQYNFDWNLKQVGVPQGFPTTGFSSTKKVETIVTYKTMQQYGIVNSEEEYLQLKNYLTHQDASKHGEDNPVTYNGRQFYAKVTRTQITDITWSGTGLVTNGMYRVSWKEQIANPVKPEP